ncbi:MAG: hypothetical protein QOI98_2093 [Solirubrobacteraceae bacterium]|jgi:hypothetical protein|nr:hypothetical protein [Solirubrobacteraceae bacterium]
MTMRIAAIAGALLLAGPVAATFGQSPFTPLPPSQQTPTVTQAPAQPTNTNTTGGGLKTWQEILMFGGGAVLLAGIGMAIVSDARRAAPVKAGASATPAPPPRARDRQRARAKAKAARRQRRRNR